MRIVGGLAASKIIALFIGPSGLALIGNFRNFLSFVDSFSTLGFQTGIIKYVAENEKEEDKLLGVISTVLTTLLIVIGISSIILLFFAYYWSQWIFSSFEYAWVFRLLAFLLPWYAGNIIFVSILNGLGKYRDVIYINIWGNVTGVIMSALLIWQLGVNGALLGLIISPASIFIFTFYLLKKRFSINKFFSRQYIDIKLLRGFFSFSLMSLVTAILTPVVYIALRNMIINDFGTEEAGYWEAINRISIFYMMFVNTLLSVYFLPKLSVANTCADTKSVFRSYYKVVAPLFLFGLLILYLLREFIITLLFTKEFLLMEKLFLWQLLGDFFKVCMLILGYEFFAKKMTKAFILTEIFSFTLLYISGTILIHDYGSEGAVMAHCLIYGILLVLLALYFRKKLF